MTVPEPTYCANHPATETGLRCNQCEKPICVKCAVHTPTGYRCKECVRGAQKRFITARWYDYPAAFLSAAVLSYIGALIASYLGFWTIFVAPMAGIAIAEAVRFVTRRHRAKSLYYTALAGTVIGALPFVAGPLFAILGFGAFGASFSLIWQIVYLVAVVPTMYYRIAGISL